MHKGMQTLNGKLPVHSTSRHPSQQLQRKLLVVLAAQAPSQPEQLAPTDTPQSAEDRRSSVLALWQAQQHAAGTRKRPRRGAGSAPEATKPATQDEDVTRQAGKRQDQHIRTGHTQDKQGSQGHSQQQHQQQPQPLLQSTKATAQKDSQERPASATAAPAATNAGMYPQQGAAKPIQTQPARRRSSASQPPSSLGAQHSTPRHAQGRAPSHVPTSAKHLQDQCSAVPQQQQSTAMVVGTSKSGIKGQPATAEHTPAGKTSRRTDSSQPSASKPHPSAIATQPAPVGTMQSGQQQAQATAKTSGPPAGSSSTTSPSLAHEYRRLRRRTAIWGPLAGRRQLLLRQSLQQQKGSKRQRQLLFQRGSAAKGSPSDRLQSGQGLPGLSKHMALLLRLTKYRPQGADDGPAAVQSVEHYNAHAWGKAVQYACRSHGAPLRKLSLQQLSYMVAALAAAGHPCPPMFVAFLARAAATKVRRCLAALRAHTTGAQGLQQQPGGGLEQQRSWRQQGSRVRGANPPQASVSSPWVPVLGCFLSLRVAGALLVGLLRLRMVPPTSDTLTTSSQNSSGGRTPAPSGPAPPGPPGMRPSPSGPSSAAVTRTIQALALQVAQWMQVTLAAQVAQPSKTRSHALWTATCAWMLVALLGSLPRGLEYALATQVMLSKGRLAHLLPALPALHLAAAVERHPPSPSSATAPPDTRHSVGTAAARPSTGSSVRQGTLLAIKRLVQQAKHQAGTLDLEGLAHMYACLGTCGKAVVSEAVAASTLGGKARRTDSLLRRLSRLARARLNSFKPRQLAVILTSLAAIHRRWGLPLEPLLLNEASKWAVHKMCNASPAQAAAIMSALASLGWYSQGLWERAASGALTRWDSDLVAAMSDNQIAQVAAAYAAVGHYSPALEARTAELLELSTATLEAGSSAVSGVTPA